MTAISVKLTKPYVNTDIAIRRKASEQMPRDVVQAPTHRIISDPLRMVTISHDSCVRNRAWKHVIFFQPVHPSITISMCPSLGPCIVGMRAESMDRKDALGAISRMSDLVFSAASLTRWWF